MYFSFRAFLPLCSLRWFPNRPLTLFYSTINTTTADLHFYSATLLLLSTATDVNFFCSD